MEVKQMGKKYADLAKEIPIHGRNGIIKLGAELEEDFFGWDTFSVRYCLIDGCGMIPEEMEKKHVHDYDQILLFLMLHRFHISSKLLFH